MNPLALLTGKEVVPGNVAGWHLTLHNTTTSPNGAAIASDALLSIGSKDYDATIRAVLTGGLEGGTYSITIEGLSDSDYGKIPKRDPLPVARLYLFWVDTNQSVTGYLKNMAGLSGLTGSSAPPDDALVAVLQIVSVSRKAGERRYNVELTAREWIFERLNSMRLIPAAAGSETVATLEAGVRAALGPRGARLSADYFSFHRLTPHPTCGPQPLPNSDDVTDQMVATTPVRRIMESLAARMERNTGRYGRKMLLVRNGKLHVGVRPMPIEGDPKDLSPATGLVEAELAGTEVTDPNFTPAVQSSDQRPPERRRFRLTLKGRPDIKPGDLVKFVPETEDDSKTTSGLLGAVSDLLGGSLLPSLPGLGGDPTTLYVESVEHRLGRTSSFSSLVTGIEMQSGQDNWDCHTQSPQPQSTTASSSPDTAAARAAMQLTQNLIAARAFPDIGEIRGANVSGTSEPPAQTLSIWRGTVPGIGANNEARRLAIRRPSHAPARGVPYASPFAWGKCGLVLPRYPGTRVMVLHRDGRADDPVEIGAVWESGKAPDSHPGDYWLSLPAAVPAANRQTLSGEQAAADYSGKVTNDLTDADGNRVIEVGELTIRVGRDQLKNAGTRPVRGTQDSVTIEHTKKGAKISIAQDGTITISGQKIVLDAGSGNIEMKAASVDVKVSGTMNVHG